MRKPAYCTRERRTTLMVWTVPWILAGIVSIVLVTSTNRKRQIVHTANPAANAGKQTEHEEAHSAPENSVSNKTFDIWPTDEVKTNFDWVDAEWLHSDEISRLDIDVINIEMIGELDDEVKDAYGRDFPEATAKYAKVPFAYAGDCGYAITNKLPYPQTSHFLYGLDAQMLLGAKNAISVDNAIILPYLSRVTWPYYATIFLPALMSIPSSVRSSSKIVISVEPPGFRDVLMNIGFRADQIVPHQGWIKGKNLIILQHPEPGHFYKWDLKHFARLQQQALKPAMYRTIGLCKSWEMTITDEKMYHLERILKKGDKRIKQMPDWTTDRISHMESFYRHHVIIGFSSNFLYYMPFMRPGSLAIIVQGKGNYLEYVSIARSMGIRVVVIGVNDMTKIEDSVCETILDVIKKYYPDESAQAEDADDN